MKTKHLFFAALFFVALTFGFVGCENPNGDLLNNGDDSSITDNDSTTNNPDQGGDNNGGTKPTTPEAPTMVATGGASDVEYSTITLWGRINTDTLWAFPEIKWGIECSTSKEEMQQHKGKKALCTTDLVGENSDEYSVAFTEVGYGKMLYYNAYLLINNMKYIYGEVDSVHLDVKLTVNRNNTSYGTVTGSGTYDHGAEATITATPKENYYFTGWSDSDSKELTRTVQVNSDTTITANFAKKPYLTANSNSSNYGTVTGSGYYAVGSEATITATPKEYYYFTGWSDCDSKELTRTVQVNSDTTITANFAKKPYLTVKSNNTSYGTVTGSGYYIPGDEVTIAATPKPGFEFVEWSDGNTDNPCIIIMGNANTTYTATFEVIPMVIAGTENGYDYVDLSLPSGTKWATCNVGATKPEEYGNYYAWGETETKTTYNWSTYKWCNGDYDTLTKYNTSSEYGTVDNKTVLDLEDDAARANWGGAWRMPTDAEWTELRVNCTWTWTDDYNGTGVAGRIVTSNINANSIFLPAAGYRDYDDLYDAGGYGNSWSSSLYTGIPSSAWRVYFDSDYVGRNGGYRYCGRSVRPVL